MSEHRDMLPATRPASLNSSMRLLTALPITVVTLAAQARPLRPGRGSWYNVTCNAFGEERIGAMAWTPNGQVGLCGSHLVNPPLGDHVFFAMLDLAGYLDRVFDTDGLVTHDVCTTTVRCTEMVVQADGRLPGVGHQDLSRGDR